MQSLSGTNPGSRYNEAIRQRTILAVVLTGGWGSRLGAICDPKINKHAINKGLVPAGRVRAIDYPVRAVRAAGINDLTIRIGHLAHPTGLELKHLHPVLPEEARLQFFDPRDFDTSAEVLGTAEACTAIAEERKFFKHFLVLSCDVIFNFSLIPFIAAHLESGSPFTIGLVRQPEGGPNRFGSIQLAGMPAGESEQAEWLRARTGTLQRVSAYRGVTTRHERLSPLIDASVYLISTNLFSRLAAQDLRQNLLRERLKATQEVNGYIFPSASYWRDIGDASDLLAINQELLRREVDLVDGDGWQPTSWGYLGENTFISKECEIQAPAIIGPNVKILGKSKINSSVIAGDVEIRPGVEIEGSLLFPARRFRSSWVIGEGTRISNSIFTGGRTDANSVFHNGVIYSPVGGCATEPL